MCTNEVSSINGDGRVKYFLQNRNDLLKFKLYIFLNKIESEVLCLLLNG